MPRCHQQEEPADHSGQLAKGHSQTTALPCACATACHPAQLSQIAQSGEKVMTGLRWLLAGLLMVGLASTPNEGLAQATPTVDLWQSTISDLGCKPEYEFDTLSTDDIWLLASAFGGC